MPVDRWRHKRDGPPSQKVVRYAVRCAQTTAGIGILGGLASHNTTIGVVTTSLAIVLFFAAFVIERRERRQEALAEEARDAGKLPEHR
jgi:hypothetical protein